ncbi:MAG: formimidoylglutamase [Lunatimonas sp.]|uniref:formimidoylglutamase n=1 Tax=Lunatimonas sp. TaxID=2060141 RepID=UPI00263B090F|nr:formimidoylglutamase [Lunatimonas sp.]MCC5938355.1 formimidoylglutamase [Lunatimonas sp.]
MDLKIFFEPLPERLYQKEKSHNSFFDGIHCHGEQFPDLQGIQLAIIGLEDFRGAGELANGPESTYAIREKLFRLKKGQGQYKIADLGTLKSGETTKETCQLMRSIGEFLINQEILPLFIGGSHDLDLGQFLAFEKMRKMVSVLTVDAKMDMEDEGRPDQIHSSQIVLHQPNFLFNYCHLAYQSFLTDSDLVATLEKLYFDHVRLGKLRDNFKEVEPLIRNADMLSFDLCAIKSTDAPGTIDCQPFGMTSEEACQISWFAGTNEKLSSIGFYGYHECLDDSRYTTASVVATMVWYFIEGFYHRKDSLSFKSSDYTKYTVSLDSTPSVLHFYKSNLSGKWWMEVPVSGMGKFGDQTIIPCSYEDYQTAQRGEIPERWVNAQLKLP